MTREYSRHAGRGSGTGASAGATERAPTGFTVPPPTESALAERLLAALRESRHRTLFVTELAALARTAGCTADRFERLLAAEERAGRLLVLSRPPPDVHLAGTDLRTVHLCDDPAAGAEQPARQRGEAHWAEFLRTFLATRRCC